MIDEPDPVQVPDCSGAFERVLAAVNAARLFVELLKVEVLRSLWDPWTIPEDQLKLLAWALSVDIWNDAWPIARRRLVVAEARAFHRAKTTVKGYRMALGYVDAELVRAHLPRHGFRIARAPTVAEHEAWLASLPEIRIYANVPRIRPRPPGFVVGRRGLGRAADAVLDRRRAVLIRGGVETDLVFSGVRIDATGRLLTDAERLVIPEPLRPGLKVGGALARPVRTNRSAAERIIPLSLSGADDKPFIRNVVSPTLTPIEVTPRRVDAPVAGRPGLAVGRCALGARPIRRDPGDAGYYLSIRLIDATVAQPATGRRGSALGRGRLQRAPYTAAVLVHAPMPRRTGFPKSSRIVRAQAAAEARVAEVAHALDVTAAARDTLFLDVNSTRPITWNDLERLPAGTPAGASVRLA